MEALPSCSMRRQVRYATPDRSAASICVKPMAIRRALIALPRSQISSEADRYMVRRWTINDSLSNKRPYKDNASSVNIASSLGFQGRPLPWLLEMTDSICWMLTFLPYGGLIGSPETCRLFNSNFLPACDRLYETDQRVPTAGIIAEAAIPKLSSVDQKLSAAIGGVSPQQSLGLSH